MVQGSSLPSLPSLPPSVEDYVSSVPPLPTLLGGLTFPAVLILSQYLQYGLGVTTSDRWLHGVSSSTLHRLSSSPPSFFTAVLRKARSLIPRPSCSVYGFATVVAGGVSSVVVRDLALNFQAERRHTGLGKWYMWGYDHDRNVGGRLSSRNSPTSPLQYSPPLFSHSNVPLISHYLRLTLVTMLLFPLLNGRYFAATTPSSYISLGSFSRGAGGSIPTAAVNGVDKYASPLGRSRILSLGEKYGCHTCGTRRLLRSYGPSSILPSMSSSSSSGVGAASASAFPPLPTFHADHMPPSSIVRSVNSRLWRRVSGMYLTQRFYPQCTPCSNAQGGLLNGLITGGGGGGAASSSSSASSKRVGELLRGYNHAFVPRRHHAVGLLLALLTTPTERDGREGRPGGYQNLKEAEKGIEDTISSILPFV